MAFQRSRRDVADAATATKRLELQIAELERQADEPGRQAQNVGQGNITEQLAELRRQHADLQARQERTTALSLRLAAEIMPSGLARKPPRLPTRRQKK